MGEVKEAVKGKRPRKKKNLIESVSVMMDDVSDCIAKKDEEIEKYTSDVDLQDDIRKAGLLRAVHNLLSCSRYLLEEY